GDATSLHAPPPDPAQMRDLLTGADIVLLDGHHPELARAVRDAAREADMPSVLDAGRWKPIMDELVGAVTDAGAAADFRPPPGAATAGETATALQARGATAVVTTAGPDPISWWDSGRRGEIAVPPVRAVDTLGAGDVFHGAYAYALAAGADIEQRLRYAADVA